VSLALAGCAAGLLVPGAASEVKHLSPSERELLLSLVLDVAGGRVPVIAGTSSESSAESARLARAAQAGGAGAILCAVPERLYLRPGDVEGFFRPIHDSVDLPLIIQDLQWSGPGLPLPVIVDLAARLPRLRGIKIETVPAGPKYSAVRQALGPAFFICGGWAVPQMIEALDRGVDAMVPEASMVPVYARIDALYRQGDRPAASALFRRLLPVLAFSNQDLPTSIAFFKRLLVRLGVFRSARMRGSDACWDAFNSRVADELIGLYLDLEASL
jgi:4-hydroxy-tetrahydrodipicolinate synthase